MLMHIDPKYVGCREVERFLYDYSERALDQRLLMALDSHTLTCRRCQETTESYKKSNDTVKKHITKDIKIPPGFKEKLRKALETCAD